jgi:heme a synthase
MTDTRRRYLMLAMFATLFALCTAVFGAFVRLSNAGLSCPDWPTCYGRVTWPTETHHIDAANAAFPERPVDVTRAWREQVHRFLAGGLILTTFGLAISGWRRRHVPGQPWKVPIAASVLIVFQALLGMWTVTWKLKPVVVMAHLLGGFATFALLAWIMFRTARMRDGTLTAAVASDRSAALSRTLGGAAPYTMGGDVALAPKQALVVVGIVLLAIQIALGGWTSANYAALACGTDFPQCLGQWWPPTDFREAFVLWRGIGVDYEGGVLDAPARAAIHLTHRLFAIAVFGHLLGLALRCLELPGFRALGGVLLTLLLAQVSLGIANVMDGLPLVVATAHNAGAALLLATLVALLARIRPQAQ